MSVLARLTAAAAAAALAVPLVVTPAAAAAEPPGHEPVHLVAVTGTDDGLWVRWSDQPAWQPLGGHLTGAPTVVVTPGHDRAWFVGVGTDENVWIRSLTAGWQALGPASTRCRGVGAAVSYQVLAVACRGADDALWVGRTVLPDDGGVPGLSRWRPLGGSLRHAPAVAAQDEEAPSFTYAVIGVDDRVWFRGDWEDTGWGRRHDHRCGPVGVSERRSQACGELATGSLRAWHFRTGPQGRVTPGRVVGRPAVVEDADRVWFYVLGTDGGVWVASHGVDDDTGFVAWGGAGRHGLSGWSFSVEPSWR
jgi:hypothetical protein